MSAAETKAEAKTAPNLDALRKSQWTLVCGLYWGAFLLLLLSVWVHSKETRTETGSVFVAWCLGALFLAALAAAIWQTVQLRTLPALKTSAQEQLIARLHGMGTPLLYGLSAALLALMLVLLFQSPTRLGAFPEVSSGVLLALMGALAGSLFATGPTKKLNQEQLLETLTKRRQQVMTGCLIVGGIFVVVGIILFLRNRPWTTIFPEGVGAVLLGLIFLGIGMWHTLATPRELTVSNMRILILIAGGTAGFVIALMTFIRALMWRNLVFAGGMSIWQGPDAWQLWLCVWLELLGLALMFGSLYLAQADIRFNPVLRRLLYGYNAVFTGLLVLAALGALNVVVYASLPYTFNWTKDLGFYSISDKSKNLLQRLKKPTTVWIVMASKDEKYNDIKNLLENCQAYTSSLSVSEISPDRQLDDYTELSNKYPKLAEARKAAGFHGGKGSGLLLVYGSEDPNPKAPAPPHAFIPDSELVEAPQMMQERKYVFKGEDVLMTQLSFLVGGEQKPTIYFTQSNEEIDIKNAAPKFKDAGGMLRDKLESANYAVKQLFWGLPTEKTGDAAFSQKKAKDSHAVPEDAKTVIIAWPKTPFTKEVLEALTDYMSPKRGGKLIVLTSCVDINRKPIKTGLEDFLKKYGVELRDDFIIHFGAESNDLHMVDARPRTKSDNLIPQSFRNNIFQFDTPRTVKPLPGAAGFTGEVILEVVAKQGGAAWVETDLSLAGNLTAHLNDLYKKGKLLDRPSEGPIPVGLAVSDSKSPRLVVFGDGRMASNYPPPTGDPYHDLIASSVAWLGERPENIGIAPKVSGTYTLPINQKGFSRQRLVLLPFALMSLGLIGIGMGVWVVRRP